MSNFIQGRFDVLPPPITVLRLPAVKDAFVNAHIPTLNYGGAPPIFWWVPSTSLFWASIWQLYPMKSFYMLSWS